MCGGVCVMRDAAFFFTQVVWGHYYLGRKFFLKYAINRFLLSVIRLY